jgi:2-dehydro-3-deoxyglucarate aldolase/4-hydroxy-2-oxoheptanedioate aldolase
MTALFKTQLAQGKPLIGTILSLPAPELAEMCVDAGFDWLFIDLEHGVLEILDVQRILQAVGARREIPCLVRVPTNDEVWIKKVLDTGADGLIIPHVNSSDDARRAVQYSKYPPDGSRSVGIGRAHRYGARFQEYLDRANNDVAVVVQAEHIDAVKNIESILAVKGIDAVLIGPYDLSASVNRPGQVTDPEVQAAIARVKQACATKQIPISIFAGNVAAARQALNDGYNFVAVSTDAGLISGMYGQLVKSLRG